MSTFNEIARLPSSGWILFALLDPGASLVMSFAKRRR